MNLLEFLEQGGVLAIGHKSVYLSGDDFVCEYLNDQKNLKTFDGAIKWLMA